MFVRNKRSVGRGGVYEYLQIVRSYREGGKVRQQIIGTLGRRDHLVASGELDGLLRSLAKFSEKLRVVAAVRESGLTARTARQWGPALVFGRLWDRQGLPDLLRKLARDRKFEFDLERAIFALALQRLCAPGSDLAGSEWVETVESPGFDGLALQDFYRSAAFLAGVRQDLESRLFNRDLNLFNQTLEVVFLDTTSLYCYRGSETQWRKRGYSRDRRPDLPQFVLCVAVNATGWPIAWEIFPGNTADQKALGQVVELLRQRFHIRRVTVVADRGMISRDTITMLTEHHQAPFDYVLGCRMRRQKEVGEAVLARAGRYQQVAANLEVKEVRVGDQRYVVCRNPQEALKDAAAREAILEKLRQTVEKQGPKAIIGNRGYARFLKVAQGSVSIDEEAIKRDARLDGQRYQLRTDLVGAAHHAFAAAGVRPPATVTPLGPVS
ncbi:MAG: IS1634 family transposase [Desulfobacterales bacterium]|nr:IS1634 family transposase [Desulfobacterales bacterium]